MKIKLLLLLFFFVIQTKLTAQVSEDDFFKALGIIKKSAKNLGQKYHNSFPISPLLSKSNSEKEILFKDKSLVTATLLNSYDCDFNFDISSSQKVKLKSKKKLFVKKGLEMISLSFITSYYHKINFWAEVRNKCKNYKGNGIVLIHSAKIK